MNAENLTDKSYYTDSQSFPNFYGLDAGDLCVYPNGDACLTIGTLGQPRLITASLSYFF